MTNEAEQNQYDYDFDHCMLRQAASFEVLHIHSEGVVLRMRLRQCVRFAAERTLRHDSYSRPSNPS